MLQCGCSRNLVNAYSVLPIRLVESHIERSERSVATRRTFVQIVLVFPGTTNCERDVCHIASGGITNSIRTAILVQFELFCHLILDAHRDIGPGTSKTHRTRKTDANANGETTRATNVLLLLHKQSAFSIKSHTIPTLKMLNGWEYYGQRYIRIK